MKIPAASKDHAAKVQIRNPGKNSPVTSRRNPTSNGETNIPIPPTVTKLPQTIATFSGVIPFYSIGKESSRGTYNHDPIPSMITAMYRMIKSVNKKEPRPPNITITPGTVKNTLLFPTREGKKPPINTAATPTSGSRPTTNPAWGREKPLAWL